MNSQQQIKFGAIMSYIAILINLLSGLIYTPWVIRSIGKADYGLYTLAMSVISLFVFDFGLSSAVTRFISKYLAEKDQNKANNCLGLVYRLYIGIDIFLLLLFLGLFFFIPQIYKELTPLEIEKFKIVYVIAVTYSIISFPFIPLNGVLTAHEKFVQLRLCDIIHKVLTVALMTFCLILGYGLYALVLVNGVTGIFTILIKLYYIKKDTKQQISWHYFNIAEFKSIASYSGWATIKSIAQRCMMNIAPSILGYFSGSTEIAVLGIAITLEGYTFTFANAINGMFLPRVSRSVANNQDILPLMVKVGRIQIYIVGLIVFGFFLFGSEFIRLWVGDSFSSSYYCALLMIIPSFFHLPQEIAHQAIYAMNKIKYESIVFVGMAIINLILAVILAPRFGATGIGLSIGISYLLRTFGMDIMYYRKMKIDVLSFFRQAYLVNFPIYIAVFIMGVVLWLFNLPTGWIALFVKIATFCLIYLFACVITMNSYEKDMIKQIIKH